MVVFDCGTLNPSLRDGELIVKHRKIDGYSDIAGLSNHKQ